MNEVTALARLEERLGRGGVERKRALSTLKSRATRARQAGAPDHENPALSLVRAAKVPPRRQGMIALKGLGLLVALQRLVPTRALYTADLLLQRTGKLPRDVTEKDVDDLVSRAKPGYRDALRSNIRVVFHALIALGEADRNPAPMSKLRRPPLPEHVRVALVTVERFHDDQRSARSTRRSSIEVLHRIGQWTQVRGLLDRPLGEMLWSEPGKLRDLAFWWAEPKANGALRSTACIPLLFNLLLRLWRAEGRSIVEARDRLRTLQRSLRTSGDDIGPFDRLDLCSEDPAPAPPADRCVALAAWYTEEAARLRASGQRTALHALQRERLVFYVLWQVGVRRSSLAAFRYDQLKRDEQGNWYFDWCPTKRTRVPKRVVIQTWRVGDTTFSRWYVPPEFYVLLCEALADQGYDLERYLEHGDAASVPWVEAADLTFGPQFKGHQVSPVWRGKRGHLTPPAASRIAAQVLRQRLHMQRGATHAMRRRSVIDKNSLAREFPQAAEMLQHLKAETRHIYEWSDERTVSLMFPTAVPTAAPAAPGSALIAAPAAPRDRRTPAATRRPRLSLDDVR